MDKMNVITFSRTGHVLGVVTKASLPDSAPTPAEIAGGGFRLRTGAADAPVVEIAEDEIAVTPVDYDELVLYRPHLFLLEGSRLQQQNSVFFPPGNLLSGTHINLTLPAAVPDATEVWFQILGGNLTEPIVRSVTIPQEDPPTDSGQAVLSLGNGSYEVAMFAPGYALNVFHEDVP